MKKTILFLAVIALATSCKKNRTCKCTQTETWSGNTEVTTWSYTHKDTKKKAKEWCSAFNSTSTSNNHSWNTSCELQ
jgi:hypothetical protein